MSGIIILTNKIYNNDSNITEFKKYYQNNIKYIRSLVYTAQEYCNYNDTSLSSIDKNLFVNDPLFRKNTKNNSKKMPIQVQKPTTEQEFRWYNVILKK